jgi:hypothetical protein
MFDPEMLARNPLASRADASALLTDLFAPLVPCFSEGRAQVRIAPDAGHFDCKAAWFEGFARPLWGLAPLAAGGGAFAHWPLFRDGIANGTDPAHAEYWLEPGDHDQRAVEMAALGFALALAPHELWEPLPQAARRHLAAWLGSIQRVAMADNNWHFFPVMAGLGLERVGFAIDRASRDRHLDRIDDFCRADGWYGDGPGGFIDHYGGFALHFYGLIYARHAADADASRARAYRERATAFAKDFRHWFGADGAALAIGRSLTYRFAMAAFWGGLAYAGVEALPWGEIRGLWARQIRWWMRQPIFDAAGRLSVGYCWPSYLMSEEYNSPGSPYWAFKAFLPLALADDHPFWTATEVPCPEPELPVAMSAASMIIRRRGGDVFALSAAPIRADMRNSTDKYGKLAFSSRFGLSVEGDRFVDLGFVGDNLLAVAAPDQPFHTRAGNSSARMTKDFVESEWHPHPGVDIRTLQGFCGDWELRLHHLRMAQALTVIETGHAVPARCASRGRLKPVLAQPAVPPEGSGPYGLALVLDDGHASVAIDFGALRQALPVDVAPNTSIVFPHAAVPALIGRLPAGEALLATAVHAGCAPAGAATVPPPPAPAAFAALAQAAGWDGRLMARIADGPARIDHCSLPALR